MKKKLYKKLYALEYLMSEKKSLLQRIEILKILKFFFNLRLFKKRSISLFSNSYRYNNIFLKFYNKLIKFMIYRHFLNYMKGIYLYFKKLYYKYIINKQLCYEIKYFLK